MPFIGPWEIILAVFICLLVILILVKFPAIRKALGVVLIVVGILLSLTLIGAIIGIPLIFIGAVFFFVGGGKKETVIVQQPQATFPVSEQHRIMVRCTRCGSLNDEYASYCSNCGQQLAVQQSVEMRYNICPRCGSKVGSQDRFCGNCGYRRFQ